MKAVISHPYSGAIYWWFDQEREYAMPKRPEHSYYAAIFDDVDQHLDVALACALIYEEFVLPAVDAVFPGLGDLQHLSAPSLGLEVGSWDLMDEARRLTREVAAEWPEDFELSQLLAARSTWDAQLELEYAVADVLMAKEYSAPILCSDGRRSTVRRLIELGVAPAPSPVIASIRQDKSVSAMVDAYARVTGLTFANDGVRDLAELKWMDPLRSYADKFQDVLEDPGTASTDALFEAIAGALSTEELARKAQGAFEATGRIMDLVGLFPGVGTVTGAIGIGADGLSTAAEKRANTARWYELSNAVSGARGRRALEQELATRGLR